jgi:hypothetical protein
MADRPQSTAKARRSEPTLVVGSESQARRSEPFPGFQASLAPRADLGGRPGAGRPPVVGPKREVVVASLVPSADVVSAGSAKGSRARSQAALKLLQAEAQGAGPRPGARAASRPPVTKRTRESASEQSLGLPGQP